MTETAQKDWLGNSRSVHATLGSRTGAKSERHEHDYYATPPEAVRALLAVERFSDVILEPCCGEGHISEALIRHGHTVNSWDLIDRGYKSMAGTADFLDRMGNGFSSVLCDIVTNPPYGTALEFIQRSLEVTRSTAKIAMLLRTAFVESQGRATFFKENPPKTIWQFSKRITCARNGDFAKYGNSGAVAYAWFVWENGSTEDTRFKWL